MNIREQMKIFYENPVIAWHEHAAALDGLRYDPGFVDRYVEAMDTYGIDKAVTSLPIAGERQCPPEHFIQANDYTMEVVKQYPDRFYPMAFVNPGFFRETQKELERCADMGFVGVKLYHQYFMDDPVMYPMVEKCIELNFPILMHSAKGTDWETNFMQPRCTNGVHMANIARRYPEATFIMGHIGGGGDWQWSIKAIQDTPNVMADMSGSVHDCPLIEETVELLGADRVLFATDLNFAHCVGKILGADISVEDKKTILAGTKMNKFLERGGK